MGGTGMGPRKYIIKKSLYVLGDLKTYSMRWELLEEIKESAELEYS